MEIIVVLSLITTIFVFTLPRFQDAVLTNQTDKAARWIMTRTGQLKQSADQYQKMFFLHMDLDTDRMWVTVEGMKPEDIDKAETSALELPGSVGLMDVQLPEKEKTTAGVVTIRFFPGGYSDMALIHLTDDDGRQLSFLIEPFLSRVKLMEMYAEFEDYQ